MTTIDLTTIETPNVPEWLQGAWSRILMRTTATGVENRTLDCIYLQTGFLYADIRINPERPSLAGRAGPDDCTPAELLSVADTSGFSGYATFNCGICHWIRPIDFRAPSGRLDRGVMGVVDGANLWEHGLADQHSEEYTPRARGTIRKGAWALVAGTADPRPGVLVIVDDLVIRAVDRPGGLLPVGKPLQELVTAAGEDRAALRHLFESELSLALIDKGVVVTRSTLPWREGQRLAPKGAFTVGAGPDEMIEEGAKRKYIWRRREGADAAATAALLNG
jgi:hypothetical protein